MGIYLNTMEDRPWEDISIPWEYITLLWEDICIMGIYLNIMGRGFNTLGIYLNIMGRYFNILGIYLTFMGKYTMEYQYHRKAKQDITIYYILLLLLY